MPKEFQKGTVHNSSLRTIADYSISSLIFGTTDKFLLIGMDCGSILMYSLVESKKVKRDFIYSRTLEKHHDRGITCMQYSAKDLYFASLDRSGLIVIWNGGSLTKICKVFVDKFTKYLQWHPFATDEMIIGTKLPATMYLLSVTRKEIVASYRKLTADVELTSLNFNKFTGELICNFYYKGNNLKNKYFSI